MAEEFVISVTKGIDLPPYRVHTLWKHDELCVNIVTDKGAWSGTISNTALQNMGKVIDTPAEKYMAETKAALTTPNGLPRLSYSVENNSFLWKKIIDEDTGVKIKLGSIPLQPGSFPVLVQNMLGAALSANQRLESKIQNLEQDKKSDEARMNELMSSLEVASKLKNDMETDMMAQFLAVLNAKKKKISELQVELIKANATATVRPQKRSRGANTKSVKKPSEYEGETQKQPNEYEADTDDEAMPDASDKSPFPSRRKPRAGCSKDQSDWSVMDAEGTSDARPENLVTVLSSAADPTPRARVETANTSTSHTPELPTNRPTDPNSSSASGYGTISPAKSLVTPEKYQETTIEMDSQSLVSQPSVPVKPYSKCNDDDVMSFFLD